MLGGVALNEAAQAQQQLAVLKRQLRPALRDARVLLLSNRLVNPENVLRSVMLG